MFKRCFAPPHIKRFWISVSSKRTEIKAKEFGKQVKFEFVLGSCCKIILKYLSNNTGLEINNFISKVFTSYLTCETIYPKQYKAIPRQRIGIRFFDVVDSTSVETVIIKSDFYSLFYFEYLRSSVHPNILNKIRSNSDRTLFVLYWWISMCIILWWEKIRGRPIISWSWIKRYVFEEGLPFCNLTLRDYSFLLIYTSSSNSQVLFNFIIYSSWDFLIGVLFTNKIRHHQKNINACGECKLILLFINLNDRYISRR